MLDSEKLVHPFFEVLHQKSDDESSDKGIDESPQETDECSA